MKIIMSLILTLMLAGATFAGDMPQFDPAAPPPPATPVSHQATNNAMAKILVVVIQNLLSLR
jgi:hypothetical protein